MLNEKNCIKLSDEDKQKLEKPFPAVKGNKLEGEGWNMRLYLSPASFIGYYNAMLQIGDKIYNYSAPLWGGGKLKKGLKEIISA